MTDFGERLRKERESRGVTLREMADATKIGKRYLEALERNEFDDLPGTVFAKGYIRNYAEHLGLDPEPWLEDFQRERLAQGGDGEDEEKAAQDAAQAVLSNLAASRGISPARARRAGWIVGAGLLAVVLVAVLAWVFLGPSEPGPAERAEATAPSERKAAPAAPPPVVPVPAEQPEADGVAPVEQPEAEQPETDRAAPVEKAREPLVEKEDLAEAVVEPEPPAETGLSVPDHGVGTGVENRRLVGRGERFAEQTPVWFWTRVLGGRPGDAIRHVWIREGETQGTVELTVGGSHWRTQSRWSMRPGSAGAWAVEARDSTGRLLARTEFTCVPAD